VAGSSDALLPLGSAAVGAEWVISLEIGRNPKDKILGGSPEIHRTEKLIEERGRREVI